MNAPYQYLVIHRSCANLPGVLACQVAHAAGESIRVAPISDQTHVVALVAEKADELEALHEELTKAGIHHVIVREPDPPYFGSATVVGIEPTVDREAVRPFVKAFKVLR